MAKSQGANKIAVENIILEAVENHANLWAKKEKNITFRY